MTGGDETQYVVRYPEGLYQGHPSKGIGGKNQHPKVEDLARARIYVNPALARNSIAHKGGVVVPVAVALLEPKQ